MAFYRKTGIFPIMHVVGIKQEIVERHPWVAINMYKAFQEAKALAMRRMENPRIVPLAWYREAWEEQEDGFSARTRGSTDWASATRGISSGWCPIRTSTARSGGGSRSTSCS